MEKCSPSKLNVSEAKPIFIDTDGKIQEYAVSLTCDLNSCPHRQQTIAVKAVPEKNGRGGREDAVNDAKTIIVFKCPNK